MAIYKNNTEVKDIYMIGHGLPDPNAVGLQEDVDYVRYEWLKGDGSAYINTRVGDLTDVDAITCYFGINISYYSDNRIFGREGSATSDSLMTCSFNYTRNQLTTWICSNNPPFFLNVNKDIDYIKIDLVNRIASTSLQSYSFNPVPNLKGSSFYLFGNNGYNKVFADKIKSFIIGSTLHLVPCRLLHSIPASLDANNKARQEGEYGMIDLVSKKFYGNVNTSGSFTGEGLIQKKVTFAFFNGKHVFGEMQEGVHYVVGGQLVSITMGIWYKGGGYEGPFLQLPTDYQQYSAEFKLKKITGITNISEMLTLFGSHNAGTIRGQVLRREYHDKHIKYTYAGSAVDILHDFGIIENDLIVQVTQSEVIVNGVSVTKVPSNGTICCEIGSYNRALKYANIIKVIQDNRIFIPCRLLRAIPAELDGNGIARAAGVCGMYDEKNHKFYGNVASSGSFTVEGMAEGYDYEVYTYLKGTGGCYIDTLINPAWNDQLSATTEVEGQPTVNNPFMLSAYGTNTEVGLLLGGEWYRSNIPQVLINHRVVGVNEVTVYNRFSATAEIYVSLKVTNNSAPTTSCKINGVAWTDKGTSGTNIITELPNTTYKIGRDTANGLDVLKLKNVKINSHNFVPCKLKRAIPAELDANGIARNAEECGMVDTYSGLFYGNVNNVGTFTVSDE